MPLADRSLHEHAAEHLAFIRDTMARASGFTAVPGWGGVGMGVTALATAALAGSPADLRTWLTWWIGDAVLAVAIGLTAVVRKARRVDMPLAGTAMRRFLWAFLPAVAAGAALTPVLVARGMGDLLAGIWLLLYGAGVASGGALSVKLVPVMGLCVMVIGMAALITPTAWANVFMALGFGVLQIGFGYRIARPYGG